MPKNFRFVSDRFGVSIHISELATSLYNNRKRINIVLSGFESAKSGLYVKNDETFLCTSNEYPYTYSNIIDKLLCIPGQLHY